MRALSELTGGDAAGHPGRPRSSPPSPSLPRHRSRSKCAVFADRDPQNDFSELVISSSTDMGGSWNGAVSITPRREGVVSLPTPLACDPEGRFVVSTFRLVDGLVDVVVLA